MILPKEIQDIFFETLYGDRTVLEFEEWLYDTPQLEQVLNAEDYLDLIGYGYKDDRAAYGLKILLEKHIRPGEYKLWKLNREKPFIEDHPGLAIITPYDEQIERIKDKLIRARIADADCEIFGSETHEYLLCWPCTEEEVTNFENTYGVQLPLCYRSFLLKVGNGGIGFRNSGAGPSFGLYPLGHCVSDLFNNNEEKYLSYDCLIDPDITMQQWKSLTEYYSVYTNNSLEEVERFAGKLFGGILPLGSQGCNYFHAIVLNGPHKGLVVNLDSACCMPPIFTIDANFLDWYERWLDQVIDGTLLLPNAPEFGYY
jgi:hypothetical protein